MMVCGWEGKYGITGPIDFVLAGRFGGSIDFVFLGLDLY